MSVETAPLWAAFAAGLGTSFHCAAMCGPLACAVRAQPRIYHPSRLASYTLAGAIAGAVGQSAAWLLQSNFARITPWMLALVLLMLGFGLEKQLPQPLWLSRLLFRARLSHSLGWLTPLLPCGPLWLILGAAILTGSPLQGGALLAAFAAGTIPLFWLAQSQMLGLQSRLPPAILKLFQQTFVFLAAGLLIWRAAHLGHGSCH